MKISEFTALSVGSFLLNTLACPKSQSAPSKMAPDIWAVRWYLMFPVSYRDLELMVLDRGVEVDHTTIFRWIQAYATELEKRIRPHLRMSNGSWRVDETYIRVKGRWTYLYRAVDSRGHTIDFLLSARRDTAAAKRFFRKAIAHRHIVNPRTLTVDKNPAYPRAVADMKSDGQLWRRTRLRQCKYLTDVFDKAFPNRHGGEFLLETRAQRFSS